MLASNNTKLNIKKCLIIDFLYCNHLRPSLAQIRNISPPTWIKSKRSGKVVKKIVKNNILEARLLSRCCLIFVRIVMVNINASIAEHYCGCSLVKT